MLRKGYRPLQRRDVLPFGILDVHQHGALRIIRVGQWYLELRVFEFRGESAAHAVNQLVVNNPLRRSFCARRPTTAPHERLTFHREARKGLCYEVY
jgi:hypothetical protein